ncbi:uncharacterized protein LOC112559432 isoform X1 [Pomacea canaliculata]|uniref:uncharacterized protein LOC112559432 isoform X1 n=1 Tax=Pomacea canaliculata TaxID=400727 RepID=UPI000D734A09|nr:uncharacterized protein LOC112559432 isoform X1 [Pomacea canaliculata]XP_025086470.1 uncharacterized protein LOC112559432 isoform X1 [Pomacea canaliculata]XP_025086471.1 uncharacterized protein LOC112559432 isoform X1 [Pomacea canaliculata]
MVRSMGSTSHTVCCLWMMSLATLILPSSSATDFDTSVCTPSNGRVSEPPTPLVQNWMTEIAWSDLGTRHTYFVKNYRSWEVKKETVVISLPYVTADVRLLFNDLTQDVTVEDVSFASASSGPTCRVVHSIVGYQYSYSDIFYLTSFNFLFQQMAASQDAVMVNTTTVRGIPATRWSACLYDYSINMTNRATFYFSDSSWMSPFQTPQTSVPLRVEYFARRHNGSQVTEYNIIGDLIIFQQNPTFKPETFITSKGLFCPNRTGESMRFPSFPDQFSLLMEVIDQDFLRIAYQEIWYDRSLQMVRWDSKRADGSDSDAHTYIFDFNVGVKYMIDIHLMSCEDPSPLVIGDDFVMLNQKNISMMSAATYFHSEVADIQYVGTTTVRDVECNTWIGKYFDPDAEREITVQWYFTSTAVDRGDRKCCGLRCIFQDGDLERWIPATSCI